MSIFRKFFNGIFYRLGKPFLDDINSEISNLNEDLIKSVEKAQQENDELNITLCQERTKIIQDYNESFSKICDNMQGNNEHIQYIDTEIKEISDRLERRAERIENRLNLIEKNLHDYNAVIERLKNLGDSLYRTDVKLRTLEKRVLGISTSAGEQKPVEKQSQTSQSIYSGVDYFDMENHFRGTRELIVERQTMYLPYFRDKNHVVDLGCGRGEFLEVMKKNGINAEGVDQYDEYVTLCNDRGLIVFHNDALNYLKSVKSVDGIFMGQVVEHIEFPYLVELINVAFNKLDAGGVMIMETPNPMCLAIYAHTFYLDPTHNKPVHPLLIQYLAEKAGFRKTEILYTDSSKLGPHIPDITLPDAEQTSEFNFAMKQVEEKLFGSLDYALIAYK